MTDRTFRTSKGGEDSNVEPEVQVIEEEEMEGKQMPFLFIVRYNFLSYVLLYYRLFSGKKKVSKASDGSFQKSVGKEEGLGWW